MSDSSLTTALKAKAVCLGFDLAGVCPAVPPSSLERFREWLAAGYAGEMTYLTDRAEVYADPNGVLDGVRSILMLGLAYRTVEPQAAKAGQGRVSRYAWGTDYHEIVRHKLRALAEFHRRLAPRASVRGVVTEVWVPEIANHVPHLRIRWDPNQVKITVPEVIRRLREGDPSIEVVPGSRDQLVVGVWMLEPGEDRIVARRIREILRSAA